MILSGIAESGKYSNIRVSGKTSAAKVVLISVAAVLPGLWLRMMPNPSIAPVTIRHRCTIYATDSLMKFSVQGVVLRWLDGTSPACINYSGGMLADVHDGP